MSLLRKGDSAAATGDLNFAAACMAVGIPLDERCPVKAVKSDNGNDYGRFHLLGQSLDGKVTLTKAQQSWDNPATAEGRPELVGFCFVMEFLRGRPQGVHSARDLMTYAHDHLREQAEPQPWAWPRRLEDIAEYVETNPEMRSGYVFAFLLNRDLCIHLGRRAAEAEAE